MQTTTCYCESVALYIIHCWVIYFSNLWAGSSTAAVCDIK